MGGKIIDDWYTNSNGDMVFILHLPIKIALCKEEKGRGKRC